jgi:hypothetical protein
MQPNAPTGPSLDSSIPPKERQFKSQTRMISFCANWADPWCLLRYRYSVISSSVLYACKNFVISLLPGNEIRARPLMKKSQTLECNVDNQPCIMQTRKRPTCKIPKYLLSDRFFGRIQSIQNHGTLPFLSEKAQTELQISDGCFRFVMISVTPNTVLWWPHLQFTLKNIPICTIQQ